MTYAILTLDKDNAPTLINQASSGREAVELVANFADRTDRTDLTGVDRTMVECACEQTRGELRNSGHSVAKLVRLSYGRDVWFQAY